MGPLKKTATNKLWLPVTIILLLGINWLASLYHARIDLTNEKRFTLSKPTKKILKQLDDEVQVDVFLKGEFPSGFKKLANSTGDMLQEFKEIAGNKLQYNFISPDEEVEGTNVKWGDTLSAAGLYPINLTSQVKAGEQQQLVYPVALVHYKGNVMPVRLYNGPPAVSRQEINSAEAMMEFELANGIFKVTQKQRPLVGYLVGNGEPQDARTYDLSENVLKVNYDFTPFDLGKAPYIPDTFKLMMMVKPSAKFTDDEKLKLDQYVMRGGKLLLFIDRLDAEMDSLRIKNEVIAYDRGLGIDELLFKYGARVNADLVMDLQSDKLPFDVNGDGQFEPLYWNYFPVFSSKSNHAINKNLGFVSGWFVNSVDTTETEGIRKTVLLSSSPNSRTISTPALISGRENVNAPTNEKFNKANIPVAVLLEGKFQSFYNNRLSQAMSDSLAKYNVPFVAANATENKMIVVGDGDMVLNSVAQKEPLPMGVNPYMVGTENAFQFANRDFLQNCLEYLINPSGLAEVKAKDYTLRLLDKKKVDASRTTWQALNIAVPVLLVFLFAILYQWLRKRKYTR